MTSRAWTQTPGWREASIGCHAPGRRRATRAIAGDAGSSWIHSFYPSETELRAGTQSWTGSPAPPARVHVLGSKLLGTRRWKTASSYREHSRGEVHQAQGVEVA